MICCEHCGKVVSSGVTRGIAFCDVVCAFKWAMTVDATKPPISEIPVDYLGFPSEPGGIE